MSRIAFCALGFLLALVSVADALSLRRLRQAVSQPGRAIENVVRDAGRDIRSAVRDPIGAVINPRQYVNPLGVPSPADIVQFVVQNPEAALTILEDPTNAAGILAANAIVSARNAALQSGTTTVPSEIRQVLSRWYSPEIFDMVRWNAHSDLFSGVLPSVAIHQGGADAITLVNVIVFRDEASARDAALWAHELLHVVQFKEWGIFEFARRLTVDQAGSSNDVEGPAEQRQAEVGAALSQNERIVNIPRASFVARSDMVRAVTEQVRLLASNSDSADSGGSSGRPLTVVPRPLPPITESDLDSEERTMLRDWTSHCEGTRDPLATFECSSYLARRVEAIRARLRERCNPDTQDPLANPCNPLDITRALGHRRAYNSAARQCVTAYGTCNLDDRGPRNSYCLCTNGWFSAAGYAQ